MAGVLTIDLDGNAFPDGATGCWMGRRCGGTLLGAALTPSRRRRP
jgi:hypothetical protein